MKHTHTYMQIYAANVGTWTNEYIYNQSISIYETSRVNVTMNTYEKYTCIYVNIFS